MKTRFYTVFGDLVRKRMIVLRLFVVFSLNPFASSATHISGADITYKWVSGNTYQLSLTLYRDCAGIAAPTSVGVTYSSVSCNKNLTTSLSRVTGTGQEISHTCPSAITTCRGGTLAGIQKYEYVGNVTLPANCLDWIFGYAVCCRNCAITTLSYTPNNCNGVPGTYVEATLNNLNVPNNSAPTFTNIPVAFFCMGQTFHYNHGAYDIDGDSLVYSFVTPRSQANTFVTFKSGFSASNPISSSPAISLDNSGDIIITPTASEVGVMTILVKEYRNGILIGSVLRDMEVYTQSCSNVLPAASGANGTTNYDLVACPGKPFSFNINSIDGNTSQTVIMTCNSSIPGAIFTNTTSQFPVGTFSWTPTVAQARSQPYTFIISVQDNNCPFTGFQTYSYSITVPPLTANMQTINSTCGLPGNGTAIINAIGSTPLTYLWTPNVSTTASATDIGAGNYSAIITDRFGCTTTAAGNLMSPPPLSLAVTNSTDVNCYGRNNGSITLSSSGGISPLNYSWTPSLSNSTTVNNLSPGAYQCIVTDANGCTKSVSAAITQPSQLTASMTSSTNLLCNGNGLGSATVAANGGTGPYQYYWLPINVMTSTANNLAAGNYQVIVTDARGCSATSSASISQPMPLAVIASNTNVTCYGGSNGSATVSVSNGSAPYLYQWIGSTDTDNIRENSSAGTYSVVVTDSHGCTTVANATINEPGNLSITPSVTTGTCASNNGSASVAMSGGVSPYNYLWSNGVSNSNSISSLSAGVYSVLVNDANGCTISTSINVPNSGGMSVVVSALAMPNCFGEANATATVSVTGGTAPFSYAWQPNVSTLSNAIGLSNGRYDVTVTDANNCVAIANVIVDQPSQILISSSATQPAKCYGATDGKAEVTVNGGVQPYSYQWLGTSDTDNVLENSSAGLYSVIVTDAHGCTSAANAIVGEPALIQISSTSTSSTCGNLNGAIDITVNGGVGPYSYLWSSTSTNCSSHLSNIGAGSYQVTITDVNGCIATMNATVLAISSPVTSISASTNVSCFGANDGSATINATSGTPPYLYQWSPAGGNAATASQLSSGIYSVRVTDVNGCTSNSSVVINQPTVLALAPSSTIGTCASSNGSATVSVSGGLSPYSYLWSNGVTNSNIITGLSTGNYSVTVNDANGCSQISTINVQNSGAINATVSALAAPTCFGEANATATVSVNGGAAPFNYVWLPNVSSISSASGLSNGQYSVTVTDANQCVTTTNIIVNEPSMMVVSTTSTQDARCFASNSGQAEANALGGVPPYSYQWIGSTDSDSILENSYAGIYSVVVTDSHGCTAIANATVGEPTLMQVSSTSDPATCGNANGTIHLFVNGGVDPFNYSWASFPGVNSDHLDNIVAGSYQVTITDANACTQVASIGVSNIDGPQAAINSIQNVRCFGNSDGSASVTLVGGNAPFTYSWSCSMQDSSTVSTIPAGTHTVVITDSNNCITTIPFTVTQPSIVVSSATSTNVNCFGNNDGSAIVVANGGVSPYSMVWSNGQTGTSATNLDIGNYSVVVTDSNGCISTAGLNISEPSTISISATSTDVKCFNGSDGFAMIVPSGGIAPYSFLWSDGQTSQIASDLVSGLYSVEITDGNGCTTSSSIAVNQPAELESVPTITTVSCFAGSDGGIQLDVSGGLSPYSFNWNPSALNASSITNLQAGTYGATVTDANGCSIESTIMVESVTQIAAQVTTQNVMCNNDNSGSANVLVSGGIFPYVYQWSDGSHAENDSLLHAGNYYVMIIDANGCTHTEQFAIIQPDVLAVNVTSPATICIGQSVTVTASAIGGAPAYSFIWNSIDTGATNIFSPVNTSYYSVEAIDINGCRSSPVTVRVPVYQPLMTPTATSDTICAGEYTSVFVNVSGGNGGPYQYTWNDGSTFNYLHVAPIISQTYSVQINDNCGTPPVNQQVHVFVNPKPNAEFAPFPVEGCPDLSVHFTIASSLTPIVSTLWDFGDGITSVQDSATHIYTTPGIYSITHTVTSDRGCVSNYIAHAGVFVEEAPIADFLISTEKPSIFNPTVSFTDLSIDPVGWNWNFGDGESSIIRHPSHTYRDTGVYTIQLIVRNSKMCYDTVYKVIKIREEFVIYFPNTFTPNDDNINDQFKPLGIGIKEFRMLIFNRWGEVIFTTSELDKGWNGTILNSATECQMDTYVYLAVATDEKGEKREFKGHVNLVR